MPTPDPAGRPDASSGEAGPFILYVEGPRDRSILHAWAHRLIPGHARRLVSEAVILGGRRPARALSHFQEATVGSRGLCVLDRDVGEAPPPGGTDGLHFFTWGRRHIESYLLVPAAIRRALGLSSADRRLEELITALLPAPEDLLAWRAFDAKRLLSSKGPLARALGQPLPLARIARATREEELHADVHEVFGHLREGLLRARPRSRTSRVRARRRSG